MGKCRTCGQPAGLMSDLCDACKAAERNRQYLERKRQEELEIEQAALGAEKRRQALEVRRKEAVSNYVQRIRDGHEGILYDKRFVPVDSRVDEQHLSPDFDISEV